MRTIMQFSSNPLGDAVINASRQVWLAGLGAAAVTRDWAQTEASNVFRTLIKEGTAVESRTIRIVGDRLEGSFAVANVFWKQARSTVQSTVKHAAETAVTLVQHNLPRALPKVTLPAMLLPKAPRKTATRAAKAKRVVKTRTIKNAKKTRRIVKAATKK